LIIFPPCKINLGLSILSKRSDGYHNLETCFYPVPWLDVLEIIPADGFKFTTTGNVIEGEPEENLCVKAYQLMKKEFDLPSVKIHLHKIIPSGAGLGGGSSDAAYTLRLLNEIFSLKLSQFTLLEFATRLGSDCGFFTQDNPSMGTGRGEILNDVSFSLKGKFLIIVKPDVHVSTADAFAGITLRKPRYSISEILIKYPYTEWKSLLKNDFEESVFLKYPILKLLKEKLYSLGAGYASMSGSGSAVFGIFDSEIALVHEFPNCTYWSGFVE
jgi:4-diphosphocytidyl-2-C-methyl-D-erythritol kinase